MPTITADVGIWGDHPSSAWAAMAVAEQGLRPILFTDAREIGTPYASGLGVVDIGRYGTRNMGNWQSFMFFKYMTRYIGDALQVRACSPSVAHQVIRDMLSWYGIPVLTQMKLKTVNKSAGPPYTITSVVLENGDVPPGQVTIVASRWVDGSEDADFAAMAGVQFRVGREPATGPGSFGESYAGFRTVGASDTYPWETFPGSGVPIRGIRKTPFLGEGDADPESSQPFGWRCPLTQVYRNKRHWPKPLVYDRTLFEYRVRTGYTEPVGATPGKYTYNYTEPSFVPINPLSFTMHGKVDLNDDSGTGTSWEWATGDAAKREQIRQDMANEYFGLRWFLANDPSVHDNVRRIMNAWGPCADEFNTSYKVTGVPAGYPYTFYRRGTRRMSNPFYTMSQKDCTKTPDEKKTDTIGLSLYGLDCHIVNRTAYPVLPGTTGTKRGVVVSSNNGPTLDPNFVHAQTEVPLRCMLTHDVTNIVVPNAVGSTHVAYSKLRIDIWKANQGSVAGLLCARSIIDSNELWEYVTEPLASNTLLTDLQARIMALGGVIHVRIPGSSLPAGASEPVTFNPHGG